MIRGHTSLAIGCVVDEEVLLASLHRLLHCSYIREGKRREEKLKEEGKQKGRDRESGKRSQGR